MEKRKGSNFAAKFTEGREWRANGAAHGENERKKISLGVKRKAEVRA
jgi:hypothetical protein